MTQHTNSGNGHSNSMAISDWYKQPLGQWLAAAERYELDQILPDLFGYHLIQLGSVNDIDLLSTSRISHRCVIDASIDAARVCCCANPEALPIESDSVDVVVLPHTLEYADDPHQVLREVDRVLIPEGHAVILGFNPWSLWGGWRLAAKYRGNFPWNGQFRSITRIKDWCKLLGFDTLACHYYFYRPPFQRPAIMQRLQFMERLGARWQAPFAAGYVLLTKKRESRLTPVRPRWSNSGRLLGGNSVARPAARDNVFHINPSKE